METSNFIFCIETLKPLLKILICGFLLNLLTENYIIIIYFFAME